MKSKRLQSNGESSVALSALLSSCDLLVRLDKFYGTCLTSTFGSSVQKLAFFRLNLILTTHFVSL